MRSACKEVLLVIFDYDQKRIKVLPDVLFSSVPVQRRLTSIEATVKTEIHPECSDDLPFPGLIVNRAYSSGEVYGSNQGL